MNYRRMFVVAALVLATFAVQAQGFGLRAGFDMRNINGKDYNGDKLEMSLVPRFHVGVVYEIPVAPEFYFQTGLFFATKGAKTTELDMGMTNLITNKQAPESIAVEHGLSSLEIEYNLGYIELPLNLLYKSALGNGFILLGFGPYIGYGITGKVKTGETSEKVEWTNEYSGYTHNKFKPLDFGANLFFGYELSNKLSFQLNTQLGLAKINATNTLLTNDEASWKNTGFGISVGYRF